MLFHQGMPPYSATSTDEKRSDSRTTSIALPDDLKNDLWVRLIWVEQI